MPIQSSACSLASRVSGKFSCLIRALEKRQDLVLRDIKVAETRALAQAQEEEQRLQGHLEATTRFDHRIQGLLEQLDDQTFLQVPGQQVAGWGPTRLPLVPWLTAAVPGTQESQLLEPPGPLGPLIPPRWDADEQLGGLKGCLSQLCGLLLDESGPRGAPAEADLVPTGKAAPDLFLPRRAAQWSLPLGEGVESAMSSLPPHSPNSALPPRGPGCPGIGPKPSLSAEEETLAE